MPAPSTDTPGVGTPGVRRPAGVSRLGLAVASLATAGTLAVAFIGLGGPPAAADTTVAVADAAAQQVVVKTVYVQLPYSTAAPVAAVPNAVSPVVTRQSGGSEGSEKEGND